MPATDPSGRHIPDGSLWDGGPLDGTRLAADIASTPEGRAANAKVRQDEFRRGLRERTRPKGAGVAYEVQTDPLDDEQLRQIVAKGDEFRRMHGMLPLDATLAAELLELRARHRDE